MKRIAILFALGLLWAPGAAAAAGSAKAAGWTAPPARYGVDEVANFPFTTADGTVLVGSIYYPADLQTGVRAPGRFPVLVDMTPYGMWDGNSSMSVDSLATKQSDTPGSDDQILRYFASHGYIGVELDARGTGRSAGDYAIWDPQQSRDYLELIRYVAHRLDGSNGVVGLAGMSYRGMNQLMVGGLLAPGTPVKAMAPASSGAFAFNRPFFMGGFPGVFVPLYQAIESLSEVPPADQLTAAGGADPAQTSQTAIDRSADATYHAQVVENVNSGGYMAHDDQWWRERDPIYDARAIVRAGIPALVTSGPNDFFASDSLRMYAALQNVAHGRSPWAPMYPAMSPDRRYQIVYSDSYSDGDYPYYLSYELQWYDHWLKGIDNGVASTDTTMRIQQTGGSNAWVSVPHSAYPMTRHYTPYYFGSGGTLAGSAPATVASDALTWAPNQSLTYTTSAFPSGATLAGPITATVYAASSSPDVELIATLNDVAPDGSTSTVVPLAEVDGALDGANRAEDAKRNWTDNSGRVVLPDHPFTSTSQAAVPTGQVERYDIEMLPRMWSLEPGHRLALVLTSQSVDIEPSDPQLANLAGGSYTIEYGGAHASYLNLPLLGLRAFSPAAGDPSAVGIGG